MIFSPMWSDLTLSEWSWVARLQRRLTAGRRSHPALILVDSRRPEVFRLAAVAAARVLVDSDFVLIDPEEIARLHPEYLVTEDQALERAAIASKSREVGAWLALQRVADGGGCVVRVGETGVAVDEIWAAFVERARLPVLVLRGNARGRLRGELSARIEEDLLAFLDELGARDCPFESVLLSLPAHLREEIPGAEPASDRDTAAPAPDSSPVAKATSAPHVAASAREQLRQQIRRLADGR